MWESPVELWRRLRLGREEYLQRLVTTLIVGGDPPPWNSQRVPSEAGRSFLQLLDRAAHGDGVGEAPVTAPEAFVDEYLLPKLDESARNGWPDWAVIWPDRVWVIELKTEASSHRDDQLPYYLLLAAAAHPTSRLDVTYLTGPLTKPGPALLAGQRFSHLTWEQVLPLLEAVWGDEPRREVAAYVDMVRTVIENLSTLRPAEQRATVLNDYPDVCLEMPSPVEAVVSDASVTRPDPEREAAADALDRTEGLLGMARATAADGKQRGVGASDPTALEELRDSAWAQISELEHADPTRSVLPWLWKAGRTGGGALTPEGAEFGYELRFSRYGQTQVRSGRSRKNDIWATEP
jgi:hypothetical protein